MAERSPLTITRRQRDAYRDRVAAELRTTWHQVEEWLNGLDLDKVLLASGENAFGECCQQVADEQARAGQRILLMRCTVAGAALLAAAAAAWGLAVVAGRAIQAGDWLVAGLTAITLGSGYFLVPSLRRLFVVLVCGTVAVLSVVPAHAAPTARSAMGVWRTTIANEPTAMALGVFLALAMLIAALTAGSAVYYAEARAERRHSVRTVPDVVAFRALHSIVSTMTGPRPVLVRRERIKIARHLYEAAAGLENIPNLFARVELPEQREELRAKLTSSAKALRSRKVIVATELSDNELLTDCLTYLAYITLGRYGELPDLAAEEPLKRPSWPWSQYATYLRIRLVLLASISLIAVAWTTVRPVPVAPGRLAVIGALLAVVVMAAPDIEWLRRTVRSAASSLAARLSRPGPDAANEAEEGEQQ